jgi:integrase
VNRIERAVADGNSSSLWPELKRALPPNTFNVLAKIANYRESQVEKTFQWEDLNAAFTREMQQRIALDKLRDSTWERYQQTLNAFSTFLKEQNVFELRMMNRPFIESFKVWRRAKILEKKFSHGAGSLALDAAILYRLFASAVENEMIAKNPVRMEGRPGDSPDNGAQPFNGNELNKLRTNAGDDLLIFLLLRWTGLRGSDAVKLTWQEVSFESKEIERVTQKRRKKVVLPINLELLFALEAEHARRRPQPKDRVLINPSTNRPLTRPGLYRRIQALGKRAGVQGAHPHRFRDTLAVDMLSRGASPYDVAKILADTIGTVERHYAPFTKELRERVRGLIDNGEGLEKTDCTNIAQSELASRRIQ